MLTSIIAVIEVAAALAGLGAVVVGLQAYLRWRASSDKWARSEPARARDSTPDLRQGTTVDQEGSPDGIRSEVALGLPQSASSTGRARMTGDPIPKTVFFGTDREVLGHTPVRIGSEPTGKLLLGRVQVTIPPNHRIGRFETPRQIGPFPAPYDPMRHIAVNYVHLLESSAFLHQMAETFDEGKSAFIFIHGFATSFDNAARRTAQLHHDLKFPGPPLLFSWASAGEVDGLLYNKDAESSLVSAAVLRDFLDKITKESGVSTLHVIAHSMGNRALLEAIREWVPNVPPLLRQIILVAPDVNKRYFVQLASAFTRAGRRTTLYGSNRDLALTVSRGWAGAEERAGDARPPVVVAGVETIDVSAMDSNDPINHFVLDDDRVLGDMKELIDSDLPADRRLRLEPVNGDGGVYWRMKKA
jgi:esterase/lipase superfamily enzyme